MVVKRKIGLAVAAMLALGVVVPSLASAEDGKTSVRGTPLRVVTSFYPMYVLALNLVQGVPDVELVNLTKPFTGCLHDYQLVPADLITLKKANLFVINGAGMESFLEKAVQQTPLLKVVDASAGIDVLKVNGQPNPHVWLGIDNVIRQTDTVAAGLAATDPAHAEMYRANAARYRQKLEALRDRMRAELKDVRTREIVTFHEAFPYFAQAFNLKIVAVVEREPGSEPSARELADTIKTIRHTHVKALFAEPQYPSKSAETIARETGATLYVLDPVVTGPMNDPDAYLSIMDKNLAVLKAALK